MARYIIEVLQSNKGTLWHLKCDGVIVESFDSQMEAHAAAHTRGAETCASGTNATVLLRGPTAYADTEHRFDVEHFRGNP